MDYFSDGRYNASIYFNKIADQYLAYEKSGKIFYGGRKAICNRLIYWEGWERGEKQMRNLTSPHIRKQITLLIEKAKQWDSKALDFIKGIKTVIDQEVSSKADRIIHSILLIPRLRQFIVAI